VHCWAVVTTSPLLPSSLMVFSQSGGGQVVLARLLCTQSLPKALDTAAYKAVSAKPITAHKLQVCQLRLGGSPTYNACA
jgi:hypothetical protein